MKLLRLLAAIGLACASLVPCMLPAHGQTLARQAMTVSQLPPLPNGKETDIKFYDVSGKTVTGQDAFEKMPEAELVLWLAGNQFFAMDDVVHAFQKERPGTTVGLITLPPGLLLQAIKAGGWAYGV